MRQQEVEGQRNWDGYIPDISSSELLLGCDLARPREARTRRLAPAATERVAVATNHPTVGKLYVGDWIFTRNHPVSNVAEDFNAGLAPK
jgi:hypothetical protein